MGLPDDLPWIGGEATHRADVADGIRGRGIGLAQGAVDGAGDLPSPFGVGSLGSAMAAMAAMAVAPLVT
jgi:hypothetical protein